VSIWSGFQCAHISLFAGKRLQRKRISTCFLQVDDESVFPVAGQQSEKEIANFSRLGYRLFSF